MLRTIKQWLAPIPFPLLLALLALLAGGVAGMSGPELVRLFNEGFGRALGEFALLMFPAFLLAEVVLRRAPVLPEKLLVLLAPLAGALFVCPDTAYATLSPLLRRRKLAVAMGAYAGFKLLYPAGALIVLAGLGMTEVGDLFYVALIFFPVWLVGMLWAARWQNVGGHAVTEPGATSWQGLALPLLLLVLLSLAGLFTSLGSMPGIGFLFTAKGALALGAALALRGFSGAQAGDCLQSAWRRTGYLVMMIGAASALGGVIVHLFPLSAVTLAGTARWELVLLLFAITALFKLVKGSSMATFAAVTAMLAPQIGGMGLPPALVVAAICLGSMLAILPNDSFYCLLREDALKQYPESSVLLALGGGSVLMACSGLLVLLCLSF
ncbi:hypothetical protein [Chitinilyticum aquatile]|uniref:hypothetical protein n=1 Tax=Chitinilyticum aquatile TaxID=362520 RepID=UPI0003FCA71B|nr:hypothetical protein [Chitinilyticum aquatile]